MKQMIASIFSILCLAAMLAGCGPIYKTEYAYVPPRTDTGKMCTAQCVQGKNSCEQMCEMKNQDCRLRAHQDALTQFEMYKQERKREGKPLKKDVKDFDQSYTCGSSCNCEPTYNACYSACGGQVLERKVCVAFCDKQ
jgi:hypothetical protein